MRYFAVLSYDGTRYRGWQRQGNTEDTVCGRIERVLSRLDGAPVEVQGAGRTDAGVHALGQTATFTLRGSGNPADVQTYLNQYLPEDISVRACRTVPPRFHALLNCSGKVYRYELRLSKDRDVFRRRFQWHLGEALDVSTMREAADLLRGTHDFRAFCTAPPSRHSTVRTLESVLLQEEDGTLAIVYRGDGFLYNMVRILTGTLVNIGRGETEASSIPVILASRDRAQAGPTAPAQGLCLMEVLYPQSAFDAQG